MGISEVPELVGACCILHSMCQLHGEGFDRQWLEENDEYDSPNDPGFSATRLVGSGDRVRSAFSDYFKDQ